MSCGVFDRVVSWSVGQLVSSWDGILRHEEMILMMCYFCSVKFFHQRNSWIMQGRPNPINVTAPMFAHMIGSLLYATIQPIRVLYIPMRTKDQYGRSTTFMWLWYTLSHISHSIHDTNFCVFCRHFWIFLKALRNSLRLGILSVLARLIGNRSSRE